jgi:hypothetical protein
LQSITGTACLPRASHKNRFLDVTTTDAILSLIAVAPVSDGGQKAARCSQPVKRFLRESWSADGSRNANQDAPL